MQKKVLNKLADDSLKVAFSKGKVDERKVLSHLKLFKTLPKDQAMFTLTHYLKLLKQKLSSQTLTVESSSKLSSTEIKKITDSFKGKFIISKIETKIDASLLGGLRIKIGDNLFEDSIKSRIEQVRSAING